MAAKQLVFDEAARQAVLRGVAKLSKAVTATLGPKGRNVVIDKKFGSPTVTKDGVTVAKEIELEDAYENMGAQMVREVASKTSDIAGDVAGFARHFAHHLRAHVFIRVLQLDLLGDADTVFGDRRRPPFLVNDNIAAFRAERCGHGFRQFADAAQ